MKKQILSPILMLALALIMVSFISLKKHVSNLDIPREPAKADCNCLTVDPATVTVTRTGTTDVFNWSAPVGGDPILSYTIGGQYNCGGGFGTTSFGLQQSFPNPTQCTDGVIRITTNCSTGCSSAPNLFEW